MGELGGYAEHRIPAYFCLAQGLLAKGEMERAEEEMQKGDEASRHPTISPMSLATHLANRVIFSIRINDTEAARKWGSQLAELTILWPSVQRVQARLAMALGDFPAAREQLARLYDDANRTDALGWAIKIRVSQAIAAATSGEALIFLADALKQGKPEGFVRTFVDEGELLGPLLRQAARSEIEPEYARKLLTIIEVEDQRRKAATSRRVHIPQSSEFLSEREIEVLHLAAVGLSNRQIAEKLTVTLNTAKAHLHNITGKLGARSRTQAIARARELRLI